MTRVLRRSIFALAWAAIGACVGVVAWAQNANQFPPTLLSTDAVQIIRSTTPVNIYASLGSLRDGRFYVYNVPLTGDTITMTVAQSALSVNPAGTISALTVTLPPTVIDGKFVSVWSSQIVTTLTLGVSNTATITNAATTLAANGSVSYVYSLAANTWYRIQ